VSRETFENWLPTETGDIAIQALVRASVVEQFARPEIMSSDVKQVPRSGEFAVGTVAKGIAYGETSGSNDYVELTARKIGGAARIAEEDLMDSRVDILATKREDAARNLAKFFDNATLAASAASNGSTVPYTSVYKALRTNNNDVSYTADDHYVSGSATYDNLSTTWGHYEDSDWFDEGDTIVIASPAFKAALRGVKDDQARPIFQERATEAGGDMIFGNPVYYSMGCRVSSTASYQPAGNPILVIGSRRLLIKGMAKLSPEIANSNPGFAIQRAGTGVGFLTDEALLKVAMRRGFAVGNEHGFAIFEKTS
jgi:HK97 family phage major capsid protein